MAELVYSAITSLDGYVADANGRWDWAVPDEEVHAYINARERPLGTYLYGRRMYEVMVAWETLDDSQPQLRDFAQLWRAASKVVYSRSLRKVTSARTTLERSFDPEAVRALKAEATSDLSVGGAELAGHAIRAGLVDRCELYVNPIVVGGGKRALPGDAWWELELVEQHRFSGGVVHLAYRTR